MTDICQYFLLLLSLSLLPIFSSCGSQGLTQLLFFPGKEKRGQISWSRPAVLYYRVEAVGVEVREEGGGGREAAIRNGLMVEN